jgi:hypothetical protein
VRSGIALISLASISAISISRYLIMNPAASARSIYQEEMLPYYGSFVPRSERCYPDLCQLSPLLLIMAISRALGVSHGSHWRSVAFRSSSPSNSRPAFLLGTDADLLPKAAPCTAWHKQPFSSLTSSWISYRCQERLHVYTFVPVPGKC